MTEHTPGKWRACLRPGPNHGHVLAEDWSVVAICPCNIGPIGTGEANARLIAASPRLLEACRGLVRASAISHGRIEQCPADLGEAECICGFHTALDAARTAITNATTTEADRVLETNRHLLHGDTDWEKRI